MNLIYNIAIVIYSLSIRIASVNNKKAKLWVDGRKNIFFEISGKLKNNNSKIIWIHAASLGEFEQGRPLIEKIKTQNPEKKIFLTFFSPSGYEIRKNYTFADYIFYLPADTPKNAKKFIELVKPEKVYFIKYEFWLNYLSELNKNKTPIYLVSGIFRESQLFFKWYGKSYKTVLKYFTHFFVQNEISENLLKTIGIENVTISGDTRFDRVIDIAKESKNLDLVEKFCDNRDVIIAGSTWQPDEELLSNFKNNTTLDVKLILAPHEIHENNIKRIKKLFKTKVLLYSEILLVNPSEYNVLIINNIGMLSSLYKYGKIAYIGGGFGAGIHNILEAAVFGKPIVFGIKYQKFKEATDLIALKGAISISNFQEIEIAFNNFLTDHKLLDITSEISKNYVFNNSGALKIIYNKTN
jgi:3-deoxy-D-manno-octulosonic-acid transferase